jgi:hypothetical protein
MTDQDTVFGKAAVRAQAKITRKDGTVEVVDVTDEVLAENPGLLERLLAHVKKER